MSLAQRRDALSNLEGRRRRLAETRQTALSQSTEKVIPTSAHGDDSDAIARERVAAAVEKAARKTVATKSRKQSKPKTPAPGTGLNLRDEDDPEPVNISDSEPITANVAATTDSTGQLQSPPSRPLKRTRIVEEETSEHTEQLSGGAGTSEAKLASWLTAGFKMPTDHATLLALSTEIGEVPDLPNLNLRSANQDYRMLGGGIIQRSCVPERVREYEGTNEDYAANDAGFHIAGLSSILYGLRNRCSKTSLELESREGDLKRVRSERDRTKKKFQEREQYIAALQEDKAKLVQVEKDLRREMEEQKIKFEEQHKLLSADLAASVKSDLDNKTLIAELQTTISENKIKAEADAMELYDKALIQCMRAAAASSGDIPAITPEIAKWGSETLYSDFSRLGHSLVPYDKNELAELAAEDKLLGKPVWEVPALANPDVISLWFDLIAEKSTAHRAAKETAEAALAAQAETNSPSASGDNQDSPAS